MSKEDILYIGNADEEGSYPLFIGADILHRLREYVSEHTYSQVLILTEETVEALWAEAVTDILPEASVITVPAGEESKSLETAAEIWETFLQAGVDRQSLLINLGGGMISDLGGYVASSYMRGIAFINVPTTLLAQVDASVGAKTGINFAGIKNILGSFSRPRAVIIDADTLSTLDDRQWSSGLAEIIKHGMIYDDDYLSLIEKTLKRNWTPKSFSSLIKRSCEIKAAIVQEDERESGLRKLLNFGHTIGHAIEAYSAAYDEEPYLHGEAIALGMIVESRIAQSIGLLKQKEGKRLESLIKKANLPLVLESDCSPDDLLAYIRYDKKKSGDAVQWSLPNGAGSAVFNQEVDDDIVREAIESVMDAEEGDA